MKKKLINTVITTISLGVSISTYAAEKEYILCTQDKDNSEVIVKINSEELDDHLIHCISGSFVLDVSGCAPSGGFGLSAPTGDASAYFVVDRWQDIGDHFGGVSGSFVNDSEISFTGGFNGSTGYSQTWDFSINRLTGKAKLNNSETKEVNTLYSCKKVTPSV